MNRANYPSDRRTRREVEVPVRHGLTGVSGPLVVAVSGGPDSLALLLAARRVRDDLVVAHFNHGLRAEAAVDADFVRDIATQLRCTFRSETGDVRGAAVRERKSIEDAARRLRYQFLAGVATEAGATAVLVGHTANDQAESVLMHVIRGAGIQGLRGMSEIDAWPFAGPELTVRRPLLSVRRERTVAYCEAAGVAPRVDAMNADRRYTRTRVRLDVIPSLETINPRVVEALCRLARSARAVEPSDGYPAARALLASSGVAEPSAALLDAVGRLSAGPPGRRLDVGRGVVVTRVVDRVVAGEPIHGVRGGPVIRLEQGAQTWGEWSIEVGGSGAAHDWEALLPPGELTVRGRRTGDRMTIGPGMSRKLQDLFVDAHVPRYDREGWPVVCVDGRIAWVPGVRVAQDGEHRPGGEYTVVGVRRNAGPS